MKKTLFLLSMCMFLCGCASPDLSEESIPPAEISWDTVDWDEAELCADEASLAAYYLSCTRMRMTKIPVRVKAAFYNSYDGYRFPRYTCHNAYEADFGTYQGDAAVLISVEYTPGVLIADAVRNGEEDRLEGSLREIYEAALPIVKDAKKADDSYGILIRLFDAVCDRTVYYNEDPAYASSTEGIRTLDDYESAKGPLIKGYANCQGYADAFYLLAAMCGFECGKICDEENTHIWNTICLKDGNWYMCDLTFADEDPETGRFIRHYDLMNFGLEDDTSLSHEPVLIPGRPVPSAYGSEEYSYYRYEDAGYGLRFDEETAMMKEVCHRFHEGMVPVRAMLLEKPGSYEDLFADLEAYYVSVYGESPGWNITGAYQNSTSYFIEIGS